MKERMNKKEEFDGEFFFFICLARITKISEILE
jgi:hypothetical protein